MANKSRNPLSIIMRGLYTQHNLKWMDELYDNEVDPFIIQRLLCMNDSVRTQVRWLDKYVFPLQDNPKMYLSLAWSIIPKKERAPFCPYIKKGEEDTTYDFILSKVRKHFKLSDNDFNANKSRIIDAIEKDKINWFCFYGVPKKFWKKHLIDFNKIKEFGCKPKPKTSGLDQWGM